VKPITYLVLVSGLWCLNAAAGGAEIDDLLKQLKAKDVETRIEACDGIGKLGAEGKAAVSALLGIINNKDTSKLLKRAAMKALGDIGPDAKSAVSPLVNVFRADVELRADAGKALAKIGNENAVTQLKGLLIPDKKKDDIPLRTAAATTLGDFGPDAKSAVKTLKALLAEKDGGLKLAVVHTLGKIGPDAKDAIPELLEVLLDPNANVKLAAMEAIGKIGAESKLAAKGLGELVNDPNAQVANAAIDGLAKIGKTGMPALAQGLKNKDPGRRLTILKALVANKADASTAVPQLLELANDQNAEIKALAKTLFSSLGKGAVVELLKLLKDKDQLETTRLTAAEALSKLEPDKEHLVELVALLKDPKVEVRRASAEALSKLGPEVMDAFPELIAAMGDKDEAVRTALGLAIKSTGRKGVPKLQEMLAKEKDPAAKASLILALGAMGPLAKDSLDDLTKYMSDPNEEVKKAAIASLEKIGKDSVPALLKLLESKEAPIRVGAILALGEAGVQAKVAMPTLADLIVKDADATVRRSALVALKSIGGMELKDHVAKVGQALKDQDKDVRAQAAVTLADIGAAAEPAIPGLVAALADKEDLVAKAAGETLGKLGGPAVNPLVEALKDGNPVVRRYATMALKEIGAKAKNAVPMLIDALHDQDVATRQFAALALNEIGPDAKAATIDLVYAMLRDKDKDVRNNSALALLRVNPDPSVAAPAFRQGLRDKLAVGVTDCAVEGLTKLGAAGVPELSNALKDQDNDVRRRAAEILGKLGAAAKPAVPALKAAANDADPAVKAAAQKALDAIGN